MDPDVNIYQRQIQEEVKEKYALYKRIVELEKEVRELKNQINPVTVSGDEKSW
jgi:predicted nuclease with TOPRIM domain